MQVFIVNKPVDQSWNPIMPAGGVMRKDLYLKMGGIDRRFKKLFWDLDLAMRLYEMGGRVLINEQVICDDILPMEAALSVVDHDLTLARKLWAHVENFKPHRKRWVVHKKRADAVRPFLVGSER